MSLFIECDTGDLTFDDIIRLVSAIDDDGNIYLRTYDDGTASEDLTPLACVDGFGYLDILRGALVLDDDGEFALNVSFAFTGLPFLLTSVGTGLGVSKLRLASSIDTLITLDGTARFYTDAAGTLGESTTWTVLTGATRTIYIRCPSGTSNMVIATDTIITWNEWTSAANAASISGDIGQLASLTYIYMAGSNVISGNIALLTGLTDITVYGDNVISGSLAGLTSLSIIQLFGSNIITGSINALTSLAVVIIVGSNTISGDPALVSAGVTYFQIQGLNRIVTYTAVGDWSSIPNAGTVMVNPGIGYGLSSAEVDLFIIDVEATRTAGRAINITLTGSNLARTAASDVAVAAIIGDGGTVTTNP